MSLEIVEIVGPLALVAALICGALLWRHQHGTKAREAARSNLPDQTLGKTRHAASPEASAGSISQRILGKLRAGREDDRPSEDDLTRMHVGPRGVPGEAAPTYDLPENETQIPKPLDPGHTA